MSNCIPIVSCLCGAKGADIITTSMPVEDSSHQKSTKRSFEDVYELGEKLGEGGYAVVKKAINILDGNSTTVAVKIVSRLELKKKDEIALKKEYDILKTIHHPNIVHAFDFFESDGHFYVVMEYLKGGELFDRIVKKTQYNEAEARAVVTILLQSIKYCHDHDVVHRDLKPENLLLTSQEDDANLKLADFGLALLMENKETIIVPKAGTPDYIAPEVIENKPVGKPIDMWSFGVIMFILLGGYPPFHDSNQRVLFGKICKSHFTFHPKRWANVSEEAKDLIRGLLTVNPAERLTAEQALQHRWLSKATHILEANNLDTNLEELKRFNAKRRLRSGIKAVMAANQFMKTINSGREVRPLMSDGQTEDDYSYSYDEHDVQSDVVDYSVATGELSTADVHISFDNPLILSEQYFQSHNT